MNSKPVATLAQTRSPALAPTLALVLFCAYGSSWAQTATATPAQPKNSPTAASSSALPPPSISPAALQPPIAQPGEPNVKHTVIEDNGSKIDELRVRGQLTHVVVTPKVGTTKSYELIMSRSGREPPDGTGGTNTGVGKRVWNLVDF